MGFETRSHVAIVIFGVLSYLTTVNMIVKDDSVLNSDDNSERAGISNIIDVGKGDGVGENAVAPCVQVDDITRRNI